jgi:hypothetical protein
VANRGHAQRPAVTLIPRAFHTVAVSPSTVPNVGGAPRRPSQILFPARGDLRVVARDDLRGAPGLNLCRQGKTVASIPPGALPCWRQLGAELGRVCAAAEPASIPPDVNVIGVNCMRTQSFSPGSMLPTWTRSSYSNRLERAPQGALGWGEHSF